MANQEIRVDLRFNADIKQAQAKMNELYKSLQTVAQATIQPDAFFDMETMEKASKAATELSAKLKSAFDVNTGKLDLSKFSVDLKTSNRDLQYYRTNLIGAGDSGKKAFLDLSEAIASAEIPIVKINKKLKEFGTTTMNTLKWTVSSSLINNISGSIQKAYNYAQDLNKSLNDIRIVTGASTSEMDKFAERANRAAKALSASTLDYTNASLIYAQQGLNEQQIEERTAITLKMAHAAGQSAQEVSNQLTAVWNNYAKGSEDLEHFADAMVKLGADTASSSDEIAEGLEKFAAIGDTVGLSFDNAAAALATVTATTRQSADVVGTALIF